MALAIVYARAQLGVSAPLVTVEVHIANGLPSLAIVGMPETAVKESKDRVRSALLNSGYDFPSQRITVNLAPADLPKEGGRYDLAIAVGVLLASGQLQCEQINQYEFVGELALTGEIRSVSGSLPAAVQAQVAGRELVLEREDAAAIAHLSDTVLRGAAHLLEVAAHLSGRQVLAVAVAPSGADTWSHQGADLSEVKGQLQAKRALLVAAAGAHNLLLCGPPGTGKSMMAERLAGILPSLTREEAEQIALVQSLSGRVTLPLNRPFRQPHHTASAVALVGGGSQPRAGEITLAHCGVLFLDELPEFPRAVLEVLREPLERGEIAIARSSAKVVFPARFQLVAAMNPCPCGYAGDNRQRCRCTPEQTRRYRDKISGPLLDRIDLQVWVPPLARGELLADAPGVSSAQYRQQVVAARARQYARQGKVNAMLNLHEMKRYAAINPAQQQWLEEALERLKMSARAATRAIRVARTLADLADSDGIADTHLREALGYRQLDRAL